MKSLVIGRGQIGSAVAEVISRRDEVVTYDRKDGAIPNITDIDIVHICIPFTDESRFLETVQDYIAQYKPLHVIIWSTVPIGMTKKVKGAVHSPIEGSHPALAMSIRTMTRWIGSNDEDEGFFFTDYFKELRMKTHMVPSSDYTEFLKLRSTSRFGINLVFADYEAAVAKSIGMDYKLIKNFDRDYNSLYRQVGMQWAQRYILNAPEGTIGGHCVVPNAKLLNKQFPSELLAKIIAMEVKQ